MRVYQSWRKIVQLFTCSLGTVVSWTPSYVESRLFEVISIVKSLKNGRREKTGGWKRERGMEWVGVQHTQINQSAVSGFRALYITGLAVHNMVWSLCNTMNWSYTVGKGWYFNAQNLGKRDVKIQQIWIHFLGLISYSKSCTFLTTISLWKWSFGNSGRFGTIYFGYFNDPF